MGVPPAEEGGGPVERVGQARYDVRADRWWWSDETYRIYGFEPGEVQPTTELIMAHKHPDDLARVRQVFNSAISRGGPVGCSHRIVDAARRTRYVVVVAEAVREPDGGVVELGASLVDVTWARTRDIRRETGEAVQAARQHAGVIEQAKGVLMFVFDLDQDAAFALLAAISQDAQVKVHELARRIVTPREHPPFAVAQRTLSQILHEAHEGHEGHKGEGS